MFASVVDGEFDQYISEDGIDLSDTELLLVPEETAGIQLGLITPLGNMGELDWMVNAYWQGDNQLAPSAPTAPQSDYTLYNASVAWNDIAGSNFDARLWGRNLDDEEYRVGGVYITQSAGTAGALWGPPRTYGLDIIYNFGD